MTKIEFTVDRKRGDCDDGPQKVKCFAMVEDSDKVGDRVIFKSFSIRCEGTITRVGTRCVFVGDIMLFPSEENLL